MMRRISTILISVFLFATSVLATSFTIEAESMTLSGSYAGMISSPFSGIALYANNDKGTTTHAFPSGAGLYKVSVRGASNNSNAAGVSLLINGVKLKAFTFYGTSPSIIDSEIKLENLSQTSNTIVLNLETDNGSSDTYIDRISFEYLGPIVVKDPPVLHSQGAYYTGEYRNVLKEGGYTDLQISSKLQSLWDRLFYGDPTTEAVYYPVGTDEAYILDSGNDDVRSEGMSYGMMICVQMNKQVEFNRLWKWAKTYMQHQTGPRTGYFAWQVNKNGTKMDANSATDGEEYFVMALMFASGRWGDGEGIFNYMHEANEILRIGMSKENPIQESTTNLFNTTHKQVVFTPYANAATFTNPSYHLPAFYELWGKWASTNRPFWKEVAAKSREMFPKFAHSQTGLMPDYANYDGTPTGGSHADFRFDAWRCAMNMAMDYAWFKADETQVTLINRLHNFFESKGVDSYGSEFTLAGNQLNSDHSPGLVACNAAGALASNQRVAWDFIDDFFNASLTTGRYRYYDGLLYFMNYLHLSGNFRIYEPENIPGEDDDEDPNDEEPVFGYHIIDSFNTKSIGTTCDMYKKNGASTGAAVVAVSPTDSEEHVAQVTTANWDEFIRFMVTLPSGKVLSDYQNLEFDIYYNSAAANSDNGFKETFVYVDHVQIFKIATGDKNGSNHNVWLNYSIPLTSVAGGNAFTLYLGIRSNKANYFVDNVRLKEKLTVTSSVKNSALSDILSFNNNEIKVKNNNPLDFHIYDVSGKLIRKNLTSSVDISDLSSGVYVIKVQYKGEIYTRKFVK